MRRDPIQQRADIADAVFPLVGIVPQDFLNKMSVEKRIEAFRQRFTENGFYKMLVADDKEKGIVGFADFGGPWIANGFDAELYAIYFLPDFQRQGIGGNLFRLCQREMVKNGIESMCLDTLEVSPYREFYEKLGGQAVGAGRHDLGGVEFKTVIYGWRRLDELE